MAANAAKAASTEELIAAITAKLESNRAIVEQSIAFGRLTWRRTRNGAFEVDLEPRI
ncbi:MAG: hypothetical protein O2843_06530 [Chloroflexi bacterium]|nr:hypothetical protein [Chloroflexota bacterium]